MAFEQVFQVPKGNILKLGKDFDLATVATDTYKVILLASITGLSINTLTTFTGDITNLECDPVSDYTPTSIGLEVNETTTGYQISVTGASVTIPIVGATVNGILIIEDTSKSILCASLEGDNLGLTDDLTLVFTSALWNIGEQVCSL